MSKIKTTKLNITPHQKSKLRRHLRRKETAATKNNRIKKSRTVWIRISLLRQGLT